LPDLAENPAPQEHQHPRGAVMSRIDGKTSGVPGWTVDTDLPGTEAAAPPPAPEAIDDGASSSPAVTVDPFAGEAKRQDARYAELRVRASLEERFGLDDPVKRALTEAAEETANARSSRSAAKYMEYHEYASKLRALGQEDYRSEGPYLLKPDPIRERAFTLWASELTRVARAHLDDPAFLASDPKVVADRIATENPTVRLALEIARRSPIPHEYIPLPSDRKDSSLLATAIDALVGLIPGVGDVADAAAAITGRSVTGQPLDPQDRVAAAVCSVVPFLNSAHLRAGVKGAELMTDIAAQTGRSVDDVKAMFRLFDNLPAEDTRVIVRAWDEIAAGRKLAPDLLADTERVLGKLSGPLEDLAAKGVGRRRVDPFTGEPFKAGTIEHKEQRWWEHQARNRSQFPEWKSDVDPAWSRAYDRALKNRDAGSAFESAALARREMPKNNEVFISPDTKTSFVPDGLRGLDGRPVTEVKWGEPYHIVEAKNVASLSKSGNLNAELDYVQAFGGHLDLVIRKDTHLSKPLMAKIERLEDMGLVTIHRE
jgi:hypothetical protein